MAGYLDITGFQARTVMPQIDITSIEAETSGWFNARLQAQSRRLDTRLRKRYAVPFAAPYPEILLEWLTKIVTYEAYLKRGRDPSDPTLADVKSDKETSEAEIKEAADSKEGLFDLPVNDAADASAVTKGGPLGYSEQSPYVWTDLQREAAKAEDQTRGQR